MILRPVVQPVVGIDEAPRPGRLGLQRRAARRALDACARLCGLGQQEWPQSDNGVPLPLPDGHHWSIAHKPGCVAAVIADCPVGIDVERVRPRTPHLFEAVAVDDEWALLGDRSWECFFRLWTAKEAVLKARGLGMRGLEDCRVVHVATDTRLMLASGGDEYFVELFRHEDHLAAVTASGHRIDWTVCSRLSLAAELA